MCGFRCNGVKGSFAFRVEVLGFRVWGLEFRVWGLGFEGDLNPQCHSCSKKLNTVDSMLFVEGSPGLAKVLP